MSTISYTTTQLAGAIVITHHPVGYDIKYFPDLFEKMSELTYIGAMLLDKGYDTKSNRKTLVKRGFADGIMYRSNSKILNISKVNRKCSKSRYVVERTYAWFKAFRRIGVI